MTIKKEVPLKWDLVRIAREFPQDPGEGMRSTLAGYSPGDRRDEEIATPLSFRAQRGIPHELNKQINHNLHSGFV